MPQQFTISRLNQVKTLPLYNRVFYNSLIKEKFNYMLRSINTSYLIQCRSVLRCNHKSSFLYLERATDTALVLEKERKLIILSFALLNNFLMDNLNNFEKLDDHAEKCSFMSKIKKIKASLVSFSENNYYFPLLSLDDPEFDSRESKILGILEMVYLKKRYEEVNMTTYQQHINLISDIIVNVNMYFKYRCDSTFVEQVSMNFLKHLQQIRNMLLNYKSAIILFQKELNYLMKSDTINEDIFQENLDATSVLKNRSFDFPLIISLDLGFIWN